MAFFNSCKRLVKRLMGKGNQFIDLLKPEALSAAIAAKRQQATVRLQPGYDHSYFFVSTFMEDHVAFHADALYAD